MEINRFLADSMAGFPQLQYYFQEEWRDLHASPNGTLKIVHLCLVLIRKLEQFLALALAKATNPSSALVVGSFDTFKSQSSAFIKRLMAMHHIDLDKECELFQPWYSQFEGNPSVHHMSKTLINNCREIMKQIYPDPARQQDVDKVLSAAGLPTSTESAETWLKRLPEST